MYKEFIVCAVVIIIIVALNVYTENYTKDCVKQISEELETLKETMIGEDKEEKAEEIKTHIQEISEEWEKRYSRLAFFTEHDELEKVETELVSLKANIDIDEYEQGIPDLDKCIFILDHIKEKSSLKIKNIF